MNVKDEPAVEPVDEEPRAGGPVRVPAEVEAALAEWLAEGAAGGLISRNARGTSSRATATSPAPPSEPLIIGQFTRAEWEALSEGERIAQQALHDRRANPWLVGRCCHFDD